jgi:hypothetical protein
MNVAVAKGEGEHVFRKTSAERKIITKFNVKGKKRECENWVILSVKGQLAGFCELFSEPSCSVGGIEHPDELNDCKICSRLKFGAKQPRDKPHRV